jgi:hypothetical protein
MEEDDLWPPDMLHLHNLTPSALTSHQIPSNALFSSINHTFSHPRRPRTVKHSSDTIHTSLQYHPDHHIRALLDPAKIQYYQTG